ncbi:MAG: AlpA family phage regulatory protein [Pseudomonadota bacterium]
MKSLTTPVFPLSLGEVFHPLQLFRLPDVKRLLGLGHTTIYSLVQKGELDPPIRISGRAVAWKAESLVRYIQSRPSSKLASGKGV